MGFNIGELMSYTVEKKWKTKVGYTAVCIIDDRRKHRCGYVKIPKSHKLFNIGYSDSSDDITKYFKSLINNEVGKRNIVDLMTCDENKPRLSMLFDVHGGLTYSGNSETYPIKSKNAWWFGFDCIHYGDFSIIDPTGIIRTTEYVVEECENLAQQLKDYDNYFNTKYR